MTVALQLSAANNETWAYGPISLVDAIGPIALPMGTQIRMQIRPSAESTNIALELSLDNGRLVIESIEAATISILVSASAMLDVAAGSYAYDIVVEQPSGRRVRCVAGTATIIQGVTR